MAATLTGTPVAITWAAGANPAGQSVTIPSDANLVAMGWAFYDGNAGSGLLSATLNGAAPDQVSEAVTINTGGLEEVAGGVAVWFNPATGSQTLDPAWDGNPTEGPTTIVAFVKGADTSALRDIDSANTTAGTANSVTLTTVSGDLVLKWDQGQTAPGTSAGWNSEQTAANNTENMKLSSISASGATQACDSENENFSTIAAISIAPGATAPSIISVSPYQFYDGQTGIVVTGSAFGSSQGAGSVLISPTDNVADGGAITQTVTAWADTSITITAVRSSLGHGTLYLFVKDNSGASNASGSQVQFLDTPAIAWIRA